MSCAVIASASFGEENISDSLLLESFLLCVSVEERETVLTALSDNFNPDDEDLLVLQNNFKCYTKVIRGNISRVVHELAHQELLQKPRYIIVLHLHFQFENIPRVSKPTWLATNVS